MSKRERWILQSGQMLTIVLHILKSGWSVRTMWAAMRFLERLLARGELLVGLKLGF